MSESREQITFAAARELKNQGGVIIENWQGQKFLLLQGQMFTIMYDIDST
jgi:hypothetical protein